jgi:hypothetical protein
MSRLALLSLVAGCCLVSSAHARLFWQTYGAVEEGACGSWSVDQDYFVPRDSTTGRYGLYSSCKTSHTTSPACRRCHPIYGGYCSPYGKLHYAWRNHVYRSHCGAGPVCPYCGPYRPGCGPCLAECCALADGDCQTCECAEYLPNVEAPGIQILGALSVDGDPLLTPPVPGLIPAGDANTQTLNKSLSELLEQQLPLLGLPADAVPPLPTPSP